MMGQFDIPATMRAVEITQAGGPEVLKETTRDVQKPSHGHVLIKLSMQG